MMTPVGSKVQIHSLGCEHQRVASRPRRGGLAEQHVQLKIAVGGVVVEPRQLFHLGGTSEGDGVVDAGMPPSHVRAVLVVGVLARREEGRLRPSPPGNPISSQPRPSPSPHRVRARDRGCRRGYGRALRFGTPSWAPGGRPSIPRGGLIRSSTARRGRRGMSDVKEHQTAAPGTAAETHMRRPALPDRSVAKVDPRCATPRRPTRTAGRTPGPGGGRGGDG